MGILKNLITGKEESHIPDITHIGDSIDPDSILDELPSEITQYINRANEKREG